MKKLMPIAIVLLVSALASPMFLYWWGLSKLQTYPVPASLKLDDEMEHKIWKQAFGHGKPRVRKLNPYTYVYHVYWCGSKNTQNSAECQAKFPGVHLAWLAVKNQVAGQVHGKGNTVWHTASMSYTIWATRNWDVHQIIATHYVAKTQSKGIKN